MSQQSTGASVILVKMAADAATSTIPISAAVRPYTREWIVRSLSTPATATVAQTMEHVYQVPWGTSPASVLRGILAALANSVAHVSLTLPVNLEPLALINKILQAITALAHLVIPE